MRFRLHGSALWKCVFDLNVLFRVKVGLYFYSLKVYTSCRSDVLRTEFQARLISNREVRLLFLAEESQIPESSFVHVLISLLMLPPAVVRTQLSSSLRGSCERASHRGSAHLTAGARGSATPQPLPLACAERG